MEDGYCVPGVDDSVLPVRLGVVTNPGEEEARKLERQVPVPPRPALPRQAGQAERIVLLQRLQPLVVAPHPAHDPRHSR
eukprot:CAMPEP_0119149628 /NCGR_PEP_ID=MMETSP1310-20130426/43642_1 /TAXON_ID=464262 /ORGANISM="Genus nov. species nov., Strain RCC2339" /LENGTH=78 /DNA_ID=CAMNT_0007141751 /DNA_START=137 /DNA_END=373 /DNA_ORIENTATION=+